MNAFHVGADILHVDRHEGRVCDVVHTAKPGELMDDEDLFTLVR